MKQPRPYSVRKKHRSPKGFGPTLPETFNHSYVHSLGVEAETFDVVRSRMNKLIHRADSKKTLPWLQIDDLRDCLERGPCGSDQTCSAVCVRGAWNYRLKEIIRITQIFAEIPRDQYSATTVYSRDRVAVGDLRDVTPEQLLNRMARALRKVSGNGYAVICLEVTLVNEGAVKHWAPHFHIVSAGIPEAQLRQALKTQSRNEENPRPIVIKAIKRGTVPRALNYTLKTWVESRTPYQKNGRRDQNKKPLNNRAQVEFDKWLAAQKHGERTLTIGFKRNGSTTVRT